MGRTTREPDDGDELFEIVPDDDDALQRMHDYAKLLRKLEMTGTHGVWRQLGPGGWRIYVRDRRKRRPPPHRGGTAEADQLRARKPRRG